MAVQSCGAWYGGFLRGVCALLTDAKDANVRLACMINELLQERAVSFEGSGVPRKRRTVAMRLIEIPVYGMAMQCENLTFT